MCPNIFQKDNLEQIEKNEYTVFNAGKIGIKRKNGMYEDIRCSELRKKGYKFSALSIETMGGVDFTLKRIVSGGMDTEQGQMRRGSRLKNNWWIRFGCNWWKNIAKMVKDKYQMLATI